jgi:hypothetical protein
MTRQNHHSRCYYIHMDEPLHPPLELLAHLLAGDLSQETGTRAVELIQRLGLVSVGGDATAGLRAGHEAPAFPATALPPRIGVWELTSVPGGAEGAGVRYRYQRAAARRGMLDAWADVPCIELKGARRRVILAGESVARGFYYDPCFTPAQVLEALLGSAAVPGGVEVIDLARTALTAQGLAEVAVSCMALEPDALVLFAGNNWNYAPQVFDEGVERALAASVLRLRGVAGFKQLLAARTENGIESLFQTTLGPLAKAVPIVFVVPESNLADWRPELEAEVPLLPEDAGVRWLELRAAACAALTAGRSEAAQLAQRMLELDEGTAATAWSLLAAVARREGNGEQARDLLERARDARSWDHARVPGLPALGRQALRRSALAAGIELVDLPDLFREAAAGELPGRDLFLDYCHLSALGIRIAMAATGERLLPMLGGRPAHRAELLARAPEPAPRIEAEAHFAAAVHNAHWGQAAEIVRHHCRLAAGSPEVAEVMRDFIDVQVGHAPSWASVAAERISARGPSALARLAPWSELFSENKLFDAVLLDALTDALAESGNVAESDLLLRTRLVGLRLAQRGLERGRGLDLLDPYNFPSHAAREGLWHPHFYYLAYAPLSRFPLVADGTADVALELTFRQRAGGTLRGPKTAAQGGGAADTRDTGTLLVNGFALGSLPMSDRWTTRRLLAPASTLRPGVNWIEVRWPLRPAARASALDEQARRIERGVPYCLLSVYGEIHTFTAVLADARHRAENDYVRGAA